MDRGITIDTETLEKLLGINVISTIAPQKKGIKELKEGMLSPRQPTIRIKYDPVIEEYIEKISKLLPSTNISSRSLSVMILSEDESLRDWLKANVREETLLKIEGLRDECKLKVKEAIGYVINKTR
ncbi:MAG: hypothetical protein HY099_02740, partial [Nitrospirae bacterium]|nr:hypothetical protein [Nitrospirota bacterium]